MGLEQILLGDHRHRHGDGDGDGSAGLIRHAHGYEAFANLCFLGFRRRVWDGLPADSGAAAGFDLVVSSLALHHIRTDPRTAAKRVGAAALWDSPLLRTQTNNTDDRVMGGRRRVRRAELRPVS